jgi:hypothetical protein
MQAIQSPTSYTFPAQVIQLKTPFAPLTNVRTIDVYEPENLGLVISGPLNREEFDYIRAAYEKKLELTDYPYLYLELHFCNRTSPQQIWDELTHELKIMGDFCRIAIVRSAAAAVNTGALDVPGVIIHQFQLADAEVAKQWLI